MNEVHIQYDKTSKCLELFDKENAQHVDADDFADMLGSGFKVDQEEECILIEVPLRFTIQMKNDVVGNYTTLAQCSVETNKNVFEGLIRAFPNDMLRVISPYGNVFALYEPDEKTVGKYILFDRDGNVVNDVPDTSV